MIKSKKKGGKATTQLSPIISEQIMGGPKIVEHKSSKYTEHLEPEPIRNDAIYNDYNMHVNLKLKELSEKESDKQKLLIKSEKHCFDKTFVNLNNASGLILNNQFPNIEKEIVEMIKKINNNNSLGELKNIVNVTIEEDDNDETITIKYATLIKQYSKKLKEDSEKIEINLNEFKTKWNVKRKGGGVLQHLYDGTNPDLVAMEYIQYVKDINNNEKLDLIRAIVNARTLGAAKTKIADDGLLAPRDIIKYQSFFEFIFSNKQTVISAKLEIPAVEKFPIATLQRNETRQANGNQTNILKYEYNAHEYNKDIVIDFEKNLIENQAYIIEFMKKQNDFIDTDLTPEERWTIRDYTSYNANPFYGAYKKSKLQGNPNWFQEYKAGNGNLLFDNAYLPQILKYINDKEKFIRLKEFIISNLHRLNNDVQSPGNPSIGLQYGADYFNKEDWEQILDMFEEDVNNIIKKMPTPLKPIYCYRGVTYHYVSLDAWDARGGEYSLNCYYLSRITSLSLDFNKAKFFYNSIDYGDYKNPNKHLYRAVIMPGCNMLFVPSLSALPDEYEIILPTYSLVLDAKGWNNQLDTPALKNYDDYQRAFNERALDTIKYNNRTNEYGVCGSKSDKLISSDIVIIGTFEEDNPQGRRAFNLQ